MLDHMIYNKEKYFGLPKEVTIPAGSQIIISGTTTPERVLKSFKASVVGLMQTYLDTILYTIPLPAYMVQIVPELTTASGYVDNQSDGQIQATFFYVSASNCISENGGVFSSLICFAEHALALLKGVIACQA